MTSGLVVALSLMMAPASVAAGECRDCATVTLTLTGPIEMIEFAFRRSVSAEERRRMIALAKKTILQNKDETGADYFVRSADPSRKIISQQDVDEVRSFLLNSDDMDRVLDMLEYPYTNAERERACATILAKGTDEQILRSLGGVGRSAMPMASCTIGSVIDQMKARIATTKDKNVAAMASRYEFWRLMGFSAEQRTSLEHALK